MNIVINKAKDYPLERLIEKVTELIYQGFEAKFTATLFSKEQAKKITALLSYFLCTTKENQLLIAESNQEICGCLFLTEQEDTYYYLKHLMRGKFTLLDRLKISLLLMLLSYKPKKGELHIDFISILPRYRNKKVGHLLLSHCQKIAKHQQKYLSLYVAKDNTPALVLYQNKGFFFIKKTTSILSQLIVKNKQWYFMEWRNQHENRYNRNNY
ncbi:GNAT family N-acetyltransferase [Enterococcus wangshanyuanii]|uniref:N-acetyltransferase n=1 Tax=Enterococcus wangshanyuanii TaxID=2005703 RepID=A0ABQ1PI12_9ENTE|nr:GNAT family N-acetyltransferase [Enterococcus wangshanyuanii]GGC97423.1 N-acetyltransferase [Enterococcus wangshanyuanii]